MLGENTLGGKAYLPFLVPRVAERGSVRFSLGGYSLRGLGGFRLQFADWRRGGERHPQVGADDVDDGLPVCRVVLGEPFERVQAAEPDRGFVAAELLDRLGIQLGDAPLCRVKVGQAGGDLLVVLAAEGEHEPDRRPSSCARRQPGADGIQPRVGLLGTRLGVASDGQQPRRHHEGGDHDCGDCGKHPPPGRDRSPRWPGVLTWPSATGELHGKSSRGRPSRVVALDLVPPALDPLPRPSAR